VEAATSGGRTPIPCSGAHQTAGGKAPTGKSRSRQLRFEIGTKCPRFPVCARSIFPVLARPQFLVLLHEPLVGSRFLKSQVSLLHVSRFICHGISSTRHVAQRKQGVPHERRDTPGTPKARYSQPPHAGIVGRYDLHKIGPCFWSRQLLGVSHNPTLAHARSFDLPLLSFPPSSLRCSPFLWSRVVADHIPPRRRGICRLYLFLHSFCICAWCRYIRFSIFTLDGSRYRFSRL